MSGWITVHRDLLDHPLFRGEKFSRVDAWLWLIGKAAWKPTKFNVGGTIITLQRGQVCVSRHQLATAWKWSDSAVERFLTRLKTEQMIGRETGQGRSIITICNYAKYQDVSQQPGQATGQARGQRPDSHRTAKEPLEQGNHILFSEENSATAVQNPEKAMWDASVAYLTSAGIADAKARSLIGKWLKSNARETVAMAIGAAQRSLAVEPVSFIEAALRARGQQQGQTARDRAPLL
jgi:hypothetical protein